MTEAAHISEQGTRAEMEDAHFLDLNFGNQSWVYGGVYDGHRGSITANYAAEHLPLLFLEKYLSSKSPSKAFIESYEEISDAVRKYDSGSTAVDFFIKEDKVYTANAGDARAIVVYQDTVHQLTTDHRLGNLEEEQRIIKMGAEIRRPYVMRGLSGLMPTRSIGDEYFKPVGIIATPSVNEYEIQKDDILLIAACDGLFDFISNEEIAVLTRRYRQPEALLAILKEEVFIIRCGTDNMTVIAVKLH
ncbi:MAG: protein serine/threonine phosphatase 2C family protein [Dehalococcoidales bacterium]|nr:protein serine/threonine phosphatase 2C family protein [Dehalococcoidales bacterium]